MRWEAVRIVAEKWGMVWKAPGEDQGLRLAGVGSEVEVAPRGYSVAVRAWFGANPTSLSRGSALIPSGSGTLVTRGDIRATGCVAPADRDHDVRLSRVNHQIGVFVPGEGFPIGDPRERLLRAAVVQVDADSTPVIMITLAAGQQEFDDGRRNGTLRLTALCVAGEDRCGE